MQYSTLFALTMAAATTSACMFSMVARENMNSADGSIAIRCDMYIWSDDLDVLYSITIKPAHASKTDCDEGCGLEFNHRTWESCHSYSPLLGLTQK
ncbi:hypothetical protein ETB97_003276 [Aspergillus alliaceus]|uniref:Uncharacterized protein n=1 Tax=Petromyces alliaceus TaxID=209559 RepID=A0A8H6A1Z0_PETAA|nr:hypothetical protein ETB97_003276 [Aspergillus burnettii]